MSQNEKNETSEKIKFDDMGLKENVLRGIYSYGFEHPSLIQSKAIPLIMEGGDIIAQSQSGTGKTGAFSIGTLQMVDEKTPGCQAIIISHTRELAQQIHNVIKSLSIYTGIKIVLCIGGQDRRQTREALRTGSIIVVGTPGRIIDLVSSNALALKNLKLLVVDEADEILSINFREQIKTIIQELPTNAQIALFSATMPDEMLLLTQKFMRDPKRILIDKENLTLDGIKQFYVNVINEGWKFDTFCDIFNTVSIGQTIVYVNSVKRAEQLKYSLEKQQFSVSLIHSYMTLAERGQVMKEFRNGGTRILVSTDLLSRGIDIQQISVVINFDLPKNKECYLHRIGRSGRFGRKGIAINFIAKYELKYLKDLEKHYGIEIEQMPTNLQDYL